MIEPPKFPFDLHPQWERCRSKVRYGNKRAVRTAINFMQRGHHRRGLAADLTAYCCPVCQDWHMTKKHAAIKAEKKRDTWLSRLAHRFEVRERSRFLAERRPVDQPGMDSHFHLAA